ncbi:hypothetical protein CFC21_045672 [Triticum aestivum]|uniref:Uncharacterized protein n=2 Tax=Triticum aestivum TaxID=4565 RepID=A0A9R1JYV6_WHEAT|nr:uncharacterized protein LOC109776732 [Aegilops tauschii subsp. strangulata]XP_044355108.1 uncharacterized protein LOC123076999 [Triticum aestivum]KAF7034691.1 hypothetical protein CFC21_045672 [Triticum aestivum]
MALRTVAAKLKAPVASLKQAWAVCRPQAKHPLEGLNVDPLTLQEMKALERAVRAGEMKQTLVTIGFMGGLTGAVAHLLHSDLAAREATAEAEAEAAVREVLDSLDSDVNAVGTNKD